MMSGQAVRSVGNREVFHFCFGHWYKLSGLCNFFLFLSVKIYSFRMYLYLINKYKKPINFDLRIYDQCSALVYFFCS